MSVGLKRYNETFQVFHWGDFQLGQGLRFKLLSLTSEPWEITHRVEGDVPITVKAVVELSTSVILQRRHRKCAVCERPPPGPDLDGLWYLIENAEHNRLVFPGAGDVEGNRDTWPVPDWVRRQGELVCGECSQELQAAREAAKIAIRQKRAKKEAP